MMITAGLSGDFWTDLLGILLSIGLGMGFGSYTTMPYYRFPAGEPCGGKWTGKRSHCTSCGHKLDTRDMIPLFNWLLTRGKCRFCGVRIDRVYFIMELSVTVLSLLTFLRYGFDDLQFYMLGLGLAVCLVVLAATDYSHRMIPDPVLIVLIMLGFLYRPLLEGEIYNMFLSFTLLLLLALAGVKLYEKRTGAPPASWRYPKLLAACGVWILWEQIPCFLILAAAGCGALWLYARISKRPGALPYAIPLALALIATVLYG